VSANKTSTLLADAVYQKLNKVTSRGERNDRCSFDDEYVKRISFYVRQTRFTTKV